MHTQGRIEIFYVKMSFSSQTSHFGTNYHTRWSRPSRRQSENLLVKTRISQIEKKALQRNREVLNYHRTHVPCVSERLILFFKLFKEVRTLEFRRRLHKSEQTPRKGLPISIETTT